ncbi:hypothetical protein B0H19DRAFT_1085283 [Mycena capillaripes]|nr:hypothetical protein B0H19DRAFT_1085283 [Mycena capillaripes]
MLQRLSPMLVALTPFLNAASAMAVVLGSPLNARHRKAKAAATRLAVNPNDLTVPAAVKTAAAINGTTNPFMSLTSEVLGGQWPESVKTALLAFPASAQQDMAAAILQSLGPLLEAVIPIVHASGGASAQKALGGQ